jgi:predicted ATPase
LYNINTVVAFVLPVGMNDTGAKLMKSPPKKSVKIRRLHIRNFKAIDEIEIDFPEARMKNDPDVMIMGSKNGLGKTSVLEACSILFLAALSRGEEIELRRFREMPIDLYDVFIRAGKQKAEIVGEIDFSNHRHKVSLTVDREGQAKVVGNEKLKDLSHNGYHLSPAEAAEKLAYSLAGLSADPLIYPHFMYFHSYRKVQEGNPELGMMVSEGRAPFRRQRYRPGYEPPISAFKLEILRSMMSQAKLFETMDDEKAGEILDKLNEFVERYAGGKIEKLRPSPDNTIDFRISPGRGGESFTFDGLSSGQKEIISTLFLMWYHTHNLPGVILIDEPELHLNVEWHQDFIRQVHDMVPENQYIIATHSEDIFSSVEPDRRILLVAGEKVDR